jgi:hypothetical protein
MRIERGRAAAEAKMREKQHEVSRGAFGIVQTRRRET